MYNQSEDKSSHEWTIDDTLSWLISNDFENYSDLFRDHKIDGKALLTLTEDDLRKCLGIRVLGDVKRLSLAIKNLKNHNFNLFSSSNLNEINHSKFNQTYLKYNDIKYFGKRLNKFHSNLSVSESSEYEDDEDLDFFDFKEPLIDKRYNHIFRDNSQNFKPEAWKAVVAMIYFFSVTWLTAFVMVIVHDRVPDMQTYPPLPDIFLDNVPLIPWAFSMCELCGLTLFITWCMILLFHKHRFILVRRMFSLFGTVFLLRCFTMLITSLSVPGRHLKCKARPYGNWIERFQQAYIIWQGVGMSIRGVRTCGDYMFSGHTVVLTLLNFFITEYTPHKLYYIHIFSWVLNLFGVFFILAAHEHYSIDVFIAFYISTRLFLYYHTLANNRALYQKDRKRTRIWFPLFYFFEFGVNGIVPNQFDYPFKLTFFKKWMHKFMKSKKS